MLYLEIKSLWLIKGELAICSSPNAGFPKLDWWSSPSITINNKLIEMSAWYISGNGIGWNQILNKCLRVKHFRFAQDNWIFNIIWIFRIIYITWNQSYAVLFYLIITRERVVMVTPSFTFSHKSVGNLLLVKFMFYVISTVFFFLFTTYDYWDWVIGHIFALKSF